MEIGPILRVTVTDCDRRIGPLDHKGSLGPRSRYARTSIRPGFGREHQPTIRAQAEAEANGNRPQMLPLLSLKLGDDASLSSLIGRSYRQQVPEHAPALREHKTNINLRSNCLYSS